jgi:predicted MPP superfamily phosphohydrolase
MFISDLHFDFTAGKYKSSDAEKRQEDFIIHIKEHYTNCILCLAGDFFNNYQKTLSFIQILEKNRVFGFFVLGNHDFRNDGTKSHEDIIRLFDYEAQNNNYFHLLIPYMAAGFMAAYMIYR